MSTQGRKDGHGGSKTEYLDSWRISSLLGLRGSNRFENKREHRRQETKSERNSHRRAKTQQRWVSKPVSIPKQKFRVHGGHASPCASQNYRQNCMHRRLYIARRGGVTTKRTVKKSSGGPLSGPEAYRSVKNTQHYTTQAAPLMSLRARSAKLCAQTAVFLWQGERHR